MSIHLRYNPEEDAVRPIASVEYPPAHTISSVAVTVVDLRTGSAVTTTGAAAPATSNPNVFSWDLSNITGVVLETVGVAFLKIVFTPDVPSGQAPQYNDLEVNAKARTHLNVTYDDQTTTISLTAWLSRGGKAVTSPTSVTVTWFRESGTQLFQETDNSPDANGSFNIQKVQTLVDNEAYYADVSITDSLGTVVQRRGLSHQA